GQRATVLRQAGEGALDRLPAQACDLGEQLARRDAALHATREIVEVTVGELDHGPRVTAGHGTQRLRQLRPVVQQAPHGLDADRVIDLELRLRQLTQLDDA